MVTPSPRGEGYKKSLDGSQNHRGENIAVPPEITDKSVSHYALTRRTAGLTVISAMQLRSDFHL